MRRIKYVEYYVLRSERRSTKVDEKVQCLDESLELYLYEPTKYSMMSHPELTCICFSLPKVLPFCIALVRDLFSSNGPLLTLFIFVFLQVFKLGVTKDTTFKTPNSEYMGPAAKLEWIADRAFTALYIAAHRGYLKMAQKLIDAGL